MKEYPVRASVENLRDSADYRSVVQAIERMEPIIPEYDYTGPTNIEMIKARLAERRMYRAILNVLNPKGKAE